MEYYLSIKRSEVLTQATRWMELEDVMLSLHGYCTIPYEMKYPEPANP